MVYQEEISMFVLSLIRYFIAYLVGKYLILSDRSPKTANQLARLVLFTIFIVDIWLIAKPDIRTLSIYLGTFVAYLVTIKSDLV